MSKLCVGLVHYPVYNKNMEIITTSVANLDIHDIARNVATYGVDQYYIIHPLQSQQKMISDILDFWQKGYGAAYNPDRKTALDKVRFQSSLEKVLIAMQEQFQLPIKVIVTDAQEHSQTIGYLELREQLQEKDNCYLLLFGTGWGLEKELMEQADYRLPPVKGFGGYNHLSVRSAASIILDRLCGEKWW